MNYSEALASLLVPAGAALQWLRQYRTVSDWYIGLISLALAVGGYALCADYSLPVRAQIIKLLIWLPGGIGAVGGGTFAAAKLGNAGFNPVPRTDSK